MTKLYRGYSKLRGLDKLYTIHKETNGKIGLFLKLYTELIKKRHMSIEQVVNAVDIAIHKLPYMESLYKQLKDEIDKLQYTIQGLLGNIEALKYKISILDKTAFSIEQDCKRKQQEIRELIAQKDRIEKLIANISNEEDYSKVRQIVKENVKAVLSDNKKVISVSFTALIQTLKADPQMVNVIHNIPTMNHGEQDKNNNNITNYLQANKDKILDLVEKHYESLVDTLTNNAMDTAAISSSSPRLSLPQSSSTFPNLSTQSGTYRIEEESEIYDNSKGDNSE